MYKRIAEKQARDVFRNLSKGDWEATMSGIADDVHHTFPGDHALGGQRHSKQAMRTWFERLFRLYPELRFEVNKVAVRGFPWDMWIAVEWTDRGKTADGRQYENEGAHWIRIKNGKGVYVHGYLNSQRMKEDLDKMAAAGISEASKPPITD